MITKSKLSNALNEIHSFRHRRKMLKNIRVHHRQLIVAIDPDRNIWFFILFYALFIIL